MIGSSTCPFGLRTPGEETRFIPDGDDAVLGSLVDDEGSAVVFDATRDAVVAAMLFERVSGEVVPASFVRHLRDDKGRSRSPWTTGSLSRSSTRSSTGPVLISSSFSHSTRSASTTSAAPVVVWRRAGRDLGVAQEYLAGASSGYTLALTSVRDLYASGGPPELAGGDFGAEAHRLGTMTARMHLGLDKAFGRRAGDVGQWALGIEESLRPLSSHVLERPDVEELLGELRALQVPSQAIRTHGDFHLGRTCRTEQGWYVVDFATGGRPTSMAGAVTGRADDGPVYRSPWRTWPTCSGPSTMWRRLPPTKETRRDVTVSASSPMRGWRAIGGRSWPAISACRASAASFRPGARRYAS